jgi:hypothetical protein
VFRPTFIWDVTSNVFRTKLELINIDAISANTVTAYAGNIGDSNSNVYVGVGAGNDYSVLATSSNFTDTFIGTSAGGSTSNVRNSVFLGYRAGFGSIGTSNSISIGANSVNGGNSNIYIGAGTGIASGSNNIFLGSGLTNGNVAVSNTLLIGNGASPTIIGDLVGRRVGINMSSLPVTSPPVTLDVDGYARIQNGYLGINKMPGSYTLDVNGTMQVSDGYGVLTFARDSSGISRTTLSGIVNAGGSPPAVGVATLQVADGFFSATGVGNGTSGYSIPLKRGMFMVSAISNTTTQGYIGIAYDSTHQTVVSSNAGALIISNADSVTIAINTTWTVTYFPSS